MNESPAARHFFETSDCKAPESRSKTTGRREPLFVHIDTKWSQIFVDQTLIFSAQLQILMFGYQRNGLCGRIKRSVLHLGLWVHKRFLCITYRRCMTASATPYAKDFLSPIFGYRDRCFVIVIPLMMIFLMECSTTPILVKGLVGFIRKIS